MNFINDGCFNEKHEFILLNYGIDEDIVKKRYRGCYVIVNNGYLNCSVNFPPMKDTQLLSENRFPEWLESPGKDVECAFGILKGR